MCCRSRVFALLLAPLLLFAPAFAQTDVAVSGVRVESAPIVKPIPAVTPEQVGLSLRRLKRIDSHIQSYIDRKEAAGAVGLIARRGKVAYVRMWGDQDREAGTPMSEDTIFRIYSMSKPITSVAVMMLLEEGHFFLNDPVAKFLPEFAEMQVQTETINPDTGESETKTEPAKGLITIRDLLRHTAGFTYGVFGNSEVDKRYRQAGILMHSITLAETTSKLARIPLRFEPGTHYHYSVSVDVAGRLVEVVSGQPFDEFLQDRIFQPLGMVDTGFRVPVTERDRFATLYTPKGTATQSRCHFAPETVPPVCASNGTTFPPLLASGRFGTV